VLRDRPSYIPGLTPSIALLLLAARSPLSGLGTDAAPTSTPIPFIPPTVAVETGTRFRAAWRAT